MLHSFIGFLFDVITCQFQLKKKDEKVSFSDCTCVLHQGCHNFIDKGLATFLRFIKHIWIYMYM